MIMVKKLLFILLILAGVFGIISTAFAVFASENLTTGPLLPAVVGAPLAAYGVFRLLHGGPLLKYRTLRIIIILVVVVGILLFTFIEGFIVAGACTDTPDTAAAFVIVPGCGIRENGSLTLTLQYRLDAACDYLTAHEDTLCIVSGGQGDNEPMPEACAMRDYLTAHGIDTRRILTERDSTSTSENMAYSAALIREQYPDHAMTAVVATSGFHVFRSLLLAQHHGIDAVGLPAPTPWYLAAYCYVRESLAVTNTVLFQLD